MCRINISHSTELNACNRSDGDTRIVFADMGTAGDLLLLRVCGSAVTLRRRSGVLFCTCNQNAISKDFKLLSLFY